MCLTGPIQAVTKSGTGSWDLGLGDSGTRGQGDAGLGTRERGDVGTRGRGTPGRRNLETWLDARGL